jgi:hypothetical protein
MKPHKELQALLDEHTKPTHASKRDVHDQLRPILTAATKLSKQMGVYRDHHLNAKLAVHEPDAVVDGKLQLLITKVGACEKACTDFIAAGERLADIMSEIDATMLEAKATLAAYAKKP